LVDEVIRLEEKEEKDEGDIELMKQLKNFSIETGCHAQTCLIKNAVNEVVKIRFSH